MYYKPRQKSRVKGYTYQISVYCEAVVNLVFKTPSESLSKQRKVICYLDSLNLKTHGSTIASTATRICVHTSTCACQGMSRL